MSFPPAPLKRIDRSKRAKSDKRYWFPQELTLDTRPSDTRRQYNARRRHLGKTCAKLWKQERVAEKRAREARIGPKRPAVTKAFRKPGHDFECGFVYRVAIF